MELVTGATGYVGARLLRRLAGEGRAVRALARRPELVEQLDGVEAGPGRPGHGRRPRAARSTAARPPTTSSTRWRRSPGTAIRSPTATAPPPSASRRAAAEAGVERIVYLGGIEPDAPLSAHLRSRLEVERILLDAVPGSTALRASIVVGAGSSSFRILVRLVERLRVLPLPAWRGNRTQPIAERDVIEYLATHAAGPGRGRPLARRGRAGRAHLRRDDRADRRGDGRGTPAARSRRLAHAAGSRGRRRGHRPAARARAAADGEPRVRPAAARARRGGATCTGSACSAFDRAVERALAEWETTEPLGAR